MSKLYNEYIRKKKEDSNKYYLFKLGLFYIFIDEDAKKINKITPLNITNLNNDIVKCGFPSNSLDKYLDIFKNLGLDIEIVNYIGNNINKDNSNKIKKKIRKWNKNCDNNKLNITKLILSFNSWLGHSSLANSYNISNKYKSKIKYFKDKCNY